MPAKEKKCTTRAMWCIVYHDHSTTLLCDAHLLKRLPEDLSHIVAIIPIRYRAVKECSYDM